MACRRSCPGRVEGTFRVGKSTRADGVVVPADGRGLVSPAGAVLLRETMRAAVLARAACQPGWPGGGRRGRPVTRGRSSLTWPQRSRPAANAWPLSRCRFGQPELAGPVASDPVVNLVAGSREDTEALLDVTKPGGAPVSATSPGGEYPERDATVIRTLLS
jgi:hypothetical protein